MKSFSLYPNPVTSAKGKMTIVFKDLLEESSIGHIYDLNGRDVQKFELARGNKEYKVDISNLSTGVYFIKIANKKEILGQNKLLVNQY
ncbi:T9SS type A sorting domain-containing protein [Arachidicoccus ginsenosidivorans]